MNWLARLGSAAKSEHERYLTEKYAKKPVIVKNYPKAIKAFCMRLNGDGRTVAAMDVLAPGIGEIIGGSQREERLEVLDKRIAECHIDREHYAPTLPSPASGGGLGRGRSAPLWHGAACRPRLRAHPRLRHRPRQRTRRNPLPANPRKRELLRHCARARRVTGLANVRDAIPYPLTAGTQGIETYTAALAFPSLDPSRPSGWSRIPALPTDR
jgi:aspartyl/asparaginyl-tRNA synthetase